MALAISLPGATPGTDAGMHRTINRLKRAQGQLGALIAAVESGSDCRSVVTQLSAVRGALDKAGFEMLSSAMRDCIADVPSGADAASPGGEAPKLTLEEIRGLFLRLT